MAKSKRPGKKPPAPRAARPNPRSMPMRDQIRAKADAISAAVARVDQKINRILLALLLVLAVLWIAKPAVFGLICRYAIIMLLGFSMTLNGLAGYRKSRCLLREQPAPGGLIYDRKDPRRRFFRRPQR